MRTTPDFAALRKLTALLLGIACSASSAQTAYRCTIGSRTVYQASPCVGGVALHVDDQRSEAERAEALQTQQRLESSGSRLAREKAARDRSLSASAPRIKPAATLQDTPGKADVPKRQSRPTAPLKFKVAPPKAPTVDPGSQPARPKRATLP